MARDDFSAATIATLAKRVGNSCSNPQCRALTSGPHTNEAKAVNVGVAAHIAGASPGGARYDGTMTAEQRSDPANGIWLCQYCAKLIDTDAVRYPVSLLLEWKQQAEEIALARAYASKLGGNSLKSRALMVFVRRLFAKNFGSCYRNRATGSKTRRKRA